MPVNRSIEVTGFCQDEHGVDIELSDRRSMRAAYLVGCDGGHSLIRKAAGIDFPGSDPTTSNLIAQVEMTETPEFGIQGTAHGIHSFGRTEYQIIDGKIVYADHGPIGVLVTEQHVGATAEPTHARSQRGTDRLMRERLRRPLSNLDLAVHRRGVRLHPIAKDES